MRNQPPSLLALVIENEPAKVRHLVKLIEGNRAIAFGATNFDQCNELLASL